MPFVERLVPTNSDRRVLLIALLAVAAIAGTSVAEAAPQDHVVTMANMSYGQIPTGLTVGDTITWVNRDTVLHTVTARDKSFDIRLNPGQSARMTLQKPGAIPFYCTLHTMMRGTLYVSSK
jgi:plastocyanin